MNTTTMVRRVLLLAALASLPLVPSFARRAEEAPQDARELSPKPDRLFGQSNDYQSVASSPDGK